MTLFAEHHVLSYHAPYFLRKSLQMYLDVGILGSHDDRHIYSTIAQVLGIDQTL